ncbi:hypothetical protein B0T26DRAFT_395556 [Lasiosphaeria miniovina]|uniref:Uncharacterized protein n=1 Tax=Lasiosphaeria miniovina TaxID=1954250 RepID=A0AA40DQ49_9PEZI|nr:uncharacterized protein B0T26DRAFT_395556 [Lasiosphaeria miniovina]KAK0709132.1 hypothetical protein B0T26DRAFT_395556 [Lasiosphaeria miniovina]
MREQDSRHQEQITLVDTRRLEGPRPRPHRSPAEKLFLGVMSCRYKMIGCASSGHPSSSPQPPQQQLLRRKAGRQGSSGRSEQSTLGRTARRILELRRGEATQRDEAASRRTRATRGPQEGQSLGLQSAFWAWLLGREAGARREVPKKSKVGGPGLGKDAGKGKINRIAQGRGRGPAAEARGTEWRKQDGDESDDTVPHALSLSHSHSILTRLSLSLLVLLSVAGNHGGERE